MENKEKNNLEMREVVLSEAIPAPVIIALEKLGVWTRKKMVIDAIMKNFLEMVNEKKKDDYLQNMPIDRMPKA